MMAPAAQAAPPEGHMRPEGSQRPTSWADASEFLRLGDWCGCCRGQRWWCGRENAKGWRCGICYRPDHLKPDQVLWMDTARKGEPAGR